MLGKFYGWGLGVYSMGKREESVGELRKIFLFLYWICLWIKYEVMVVYFWERFKSTDNFFGLEILSLLKIEVWLEIERKIFLYFKIYINYRVVLLEKFEMCYCERNFYENKLISD